MQPFLNRRFVPLLGIAVLCLASCGSSDDDEDDGSQNPGADTTAPITTAAPPGGTYPAAQTVALTSNEPATIHYTTDGSVPVIGGGSTQSGPSPVSGIAVGTSPTTIQFFAVDAAGNEEVLRTQTYLIDTVIPVVTTTGAAPGPFGLLTTHTFTWESSEDGTYRILLGGTGAAGSGIELDAGLVTAASQRTFELSGWQLGFIPTQPLWFVVRDSAGNVGLTSIVVEAKQLAAIPFVPETRGLAITPDGSTLLASLHTASQVVAYDIDPANPTFHTQIGVVPVAANPNDLAITPDGTRAYVGHDTGVDVFDVGGIAAVTIPIVGVDPVADVVITPDGTRAYAARTGILYVIDIDPASPTFHAVTPAVSNAPLLQSANLAVTPDGAFLVAAWFGVGAYQVQAIDVDPASPTFHTALQAPVPLGTGDATQPATSQDSGFAFVGNAFGNMARINFSTLPIGIDLTSASLTPDATLVALDDEHLLVLEQGAVAIRIVDPESLQIVGSVPWATPGAYGAISPDGTIAYVLRNALAATQELVRVPLE